MGYPHALSLVGNGVVYVCREVLCRFERTAHARVTLDYETLVETYQIVDPWIYQQIVSYRHFAGRKPFTYQTEI